MFHFNSISKDTFLGPILLLKGAGNFFFVNCCWEIIELNSCKRNEFLLKLIYSLQSMAGSFMFNLCSDR